MARLTREGLIEQLCSRLGGTRDPAGEVDIRLPQGVVIVAATREEIPAAVQRLKPMLGYRFLGIHRADLFEASRATVSTKIGILDETGAALKAPDVKLR